MQNKIFLSETTQPMELYHHRNADLVVLYQVCYFCANRKSKMAATGQLSLTLDPMGISFKDLFFNEIPIGSNGKINRLVTAILDFQSTQK
jgi:hypothetical protein